ncbi:MAG: thymidylate kinase [Oscillospiraceae bacterium]|nr:thymidylate kinase [Oscillospiraceae bacterium]
MGRLFVIEGCDGSGKATQAKLLEAKLLELELDVKLIDFPCYDEESSIFIRRYLAGEYGSSLSDVNCYAASMFYAVDRYISFMQSWGDQYYMGTTFVSNRYSTSNAVHQMPKLKQTEWDEFIHWLFDFEYNRLRLPRPDAVIYLDIDSTLSEQLIMERYNGDRSLMDIHEQDIEFQRNSRTAALYCAAKEGWTVIDCSEHDRMRSRESIAEEVYDSIKSQL